MKMIINGIKWARLNKNCSWVDGWMDGWGKSRFKDFLQQSKSTVWANPMKQFKPLAGVK